MSETRWTDEFLEQKRQKGDPSCDDNIKAILGVSFLDEQHREMYADWVRLQGDLIAEVTQVADALPDEAGLPQATIQKIDQLNVLQNQQYDELEAWDSHIWSPEFRFHIESARQATLLACKALANRQPRTALSAMNCALTNVAFLEERYERLVARFAAQPDLRAEIPANNRNAYNRFLQITEYVRESPGLFLCDDAFRKVQFTSYPDTLHGSFAPAHCPEWVDEEKLETGVTIWQEHMPGCVLVLFTHSLPACYLDKKGVPMLYRTERLEKQEFLAQRIYETGFMVKDVMDEDGLSILTDDGATHTAWFAAAVHKVRPDLTFQLGRCLDPYWTDSQGKSYTYWELLADDAIKQDFLALQRQDAMPGNYSASELGCSSFKWLFRDSLRHDVSFHGRRLWGRGFLTATKVRYLHASMRYQALGDQPPYDVQENGLPINQEDLAYVLLTFGYVIPLGLENLGAILSREEKEAFLHCWKVIGYVMGIDDDLLTDDLDEAKALYEKIKSRQQAPSAKGMKLTSALCTLVTDLLPRWLPFRGSFAPVMIRDQMGADADDLFEATTSAASRNLPVRACWAFAKNVLLRTYFLSRYWCFDRIPSSRAGLDQQLRFMADAVIVSLQQTYERQRFALFSRQQGIAANPDVTRAEQEKRTALRDRTFTWVGLGLILILLFHPFFWIGAASVVVSLLIPAPWVGSATNAIFWLCFWICLICVIGAGLVQRKVTACLKELAFHVQSKFLV